MMHRPGKKTLLQAALTAPLLLALLISCSDTGNEVQLTVPTEIQYQWHEQERIMSDKRIKPRHLCVSRG